MKRLLVLVLPGVLFAFVALLLFQQDAFMDAATRFIKGDHLLISYIAFVLLLTIAVVCMPFTILPLVPLAASVFGPFVTSLLSIVGWTLGSIIAFLIARYLGRPFLQRFVSLDKLDEFVEMIPENAHFFFIVLLRLCLPIDLMSYALGLTKSLGFVQYSAATFVGVLWTSFSLPYLGTAILNGNMKVMLGLATVSLVIFVLGWYLLNRIKKSK